MSQGQWEDEVAGSGRMKASIAQIQLLEIKWECMRVENSLYIASSLKFP